MTDPLDAAWGSLRPQIAEAPPTPIGEDLPFDMGGSREVFLDRLEPERFVEKVGRHSPSDIALSHALASYGYPIVPEVPIAAPVGKWVENKDMQTVRQPRMETGEGVNVGAFARTRNKARVPSFLGSQLLSVQDTKSRNMGRHPVTGEVMHIDPMYSGRLNRLPFDTWETTAGVAPKFDFGHDPALAAQVLETLAERPNLAQELRELERRFPGQELFEPWGHRGKEGWFSRVRPIQHNLALARSIAEDPAQRRLFEYPVEGGEDDPSWYRTILDSRRRDLP